jgi:alpha-tubulin suppressor-like RCC1 family protein
MDAATDAPLAPLDSGLDAPLPPLDAPSLEDAPALDDAFMADDAVTPFDAFASADAFSSADAVTPATDAFSSADAVTPIDAFASTDARVSPDAVVPSDAFVPRDAFTCVANDFDCDGIDADCDGVDDTLEATVAAACPWRRCSREMGSSRPFCDRAGLVAAGAYHTCIVTAPSRELWCWGLDSSAQLPGITTATPSAPLGPTLSSLTGVIDLCAYSNGTCVLRAGSVHCEGDASPAPGVWTRSVSATDVSCGVNHMCVVTSTGRVQCAGRNGNGGTPTGQIGRPASDGIGPFPELFEVPLPAGRTARSVQVGTNFTCALLDDGSIACWGADTGILGRGPRTTSGVTHVADLVEAPGLVFAGLATTQFASCAYTSTDTYCWGFQADGVTIGQTVASTFVDRPTAAPSMGPFPRTGLVGGMHNVCGRVATGQMSCWGRQTVGEFGLMPRTSASGAFPFPQLPLPRTGGAPIATIEMALGYSNGPPGLGGHACVIAGGDVYCWGSNVAGQVGVLPASARVEDAVVVTP